ncbi:2-polyprenyl-3-methyl-6-methoxy-1,4-benzoquinone monooxygenase [Pseudohongiella sp. SYSU M77423]|uniref:2-polyprenyl-3-methyl-6-methoxy-1,4-benzoquinone monooxygenase n=1 Tax=Pseudohongiella sp. SYSU M77423 TaxID=3042312 RepID=UPI00248067C0|nr:2-polyprenyl-3-methyl-6-methoxy-1,4-benzoquinone monooxygenase [Pseudohongiella sp. SYSU M77423]MDH7942663.1 2-polyprenyl-3-methyl-6-methoxy-1,4-benzoquinone monooxygenase [Pseudohongiella sp. SYSU M77423]
MQQEHYSLADRLVLQLDQALHTLVPGSSHADRASPASSVDDGDLTETERALAAGLMRINHTGEVCAQALYQGQALTARLPQVRESMNHAAQEEVDHLAWCEDRLKELDSRPSVFNPAFYALSFGLGASAGLIGDRWSLGFVGETERQVCEHLGEHLDQLPANDNRSRAVVQQMMTDEQKHGEAAMAAGGAELPLPVRTGMKLMAGVMKTLTRRL